MWGKAMKIRKILKITAAVVIILLVAVVVLFHFYGAKAIRAGIEFGATRALKVPVTLGGVDLSIFSGRAGLEDLVIDNPADYQHKTMLKMGKAQVKLELASALSDTIKVEQILLEDFHVVLEQKGLTNNIQDIVNNLSADQEAKEPEEDKDQKPGKKLHVKELQINGVTVDVKLLPIPGKLDTMTLKLKPITMNNLGSDEKLDVAVLSSKILLAIAGGIVEQGRGILPQDIIGPLGKELHKLGAISEAALKETLKILETGIKEPAKLLEKGLEEPKKQAEKIIEGVGGIGKGIEGIFKKSKDKKEEEK